MFSTDLLDPLHVVCCKLRYDNQKVLVPYVDVMTKNVCTELSSDVVFKTAIILKRKQDFEIQVDLFLFVHYTCYHMHAVQDACKST